MPSADHASLLKPRSRVTGAGTEAGAGAGAGAGANAEGAKGSLPKPLDANGADWWPPGWDAGRQIECERDVFELLGVPYKEPWDRDCPS